MNALAKIRSRRTPWGQRALAMFVLVWLNFALQPCVMALEASHDDPCPHCPPEAAQQHAGHDMAPMPEPCVDSVDCGDLDDFNYDGRKLDVEFEHPIDQAVFVSVLIAPAPPAALLDGRERLTTRELRCGTSPPLHLRNCVFLN